MAWSYELPAPAHLNQEDLHLQENDVLFKAMNKWFIRTNCFHLYLYRQIYHYTKFETND